MNKKLLLVIVLIIIIVGGILFIRNRDVISGNDNKLKSYSCTKEEVIDEEKTNYEVVIYVGKKNKLNKYVVNSTSYFDNDSDYDKVCNVLTKEYKKDKYKNCEVVCDKDKLSVKTIKNYYVSDITKKEEVNYETIKEYLNDEFILDIDSYKKSMTSDGFTCK